ncbi:MAG: heavy metal translocating P-type ATPase [Anaerolineae bacterium]
MEEKLRCTDVLGDTIKGYQGIDSIQFDVEHNRLELAYDPRVLHDETAKSLAQHLGREAVSLVMHCDQKSSAACAACLAQMSRQIQPHFVGRLATPTTTFRDGQMDIALHPTALASAELSRVSRSFGEGHAVEGPAPQAKKTEEKRGLDRGQLEIIFTIATLLATITAGIVGSSNATLTTVLYVVAFVTGGYYGLIDGLGALKEKRLDVNLLMILAALGAATIGQPAEGAVLLFLFSLSNTLQAYAMDRNRRAISKLLDLRPPQALVRRGSRTITLPVEQLVLGDRVLVRPGERIPIDGEIVDGQSEIDQAAITGESMPVLKKTGEAVFAGTLNGRGSIEIKVTHLAQDTTLAKIIKLVEDAQSNRARTQQFIDNFEQTYALLVVAGAVLLTIVPPLFFREEFFSAFYRAMTWLVVASPCALVISTPASILSAIANGARHGVLFKGGVHLEKMATIKVVAFDKTGTLTAGKPIVTHVEPIGLVTADELLIEAASVEARSEHPLAASIVNEAKRRHLTLQTATDFLATPGQGVEANLNDEPVWIGGERLFYERRVSMPSELQRRVRELEQQGQTVMVVYRNHQWRGLVAVADSLRPGAAEFVRQLKALGVERVVMLTGDNERAAAGIAAQAGVDEFHAGLLPEDKVEKLKLLRSRYGSIAMVGDGVNDAPALATADLGIAMGGAGSDVALETADVVLMSDDLSKLPYAIALARKARQVVKQNLTFALSVIVLLVVSAFGIHLPLPLGVVGHEGSTVLVVLNGLRLLGFRYSTGTQPKQTDVSSWRPSGATTS